MVNQKFKTEYFQKHDWDVHSDPKKHDEEIQRIQIAEEITLYLNSLGIEFRDVYKFVYARVREQHRTYYLFVIKDKKVVNVNWVTKRKDLGIKIQRYWGCDVVVWYPKQTIIPKHPTIHIRDGIPPKIKIPTPTDKLGHFRYYIPSPPRYTGDSYLFNGHQRVETYGTKD